MDLVNLMYRYVNKFINSDELLKGLENIDLSKYSREEIKDIDKLILSVKNIKDSVPNEIDEEEKNRISNINCILNTLKNSKIGENIDESGKAFIDKKYKELLKDKERIRDGGKLYTSLVKLMTNNTLVCMYASEMNDKELLDFITKYIQAPIPPKITQEEFNNLANIAINEDKREALWRLALNYNHKNKDFSLVENYFIEKRDDYYLVELISVVEDDLNMKNLMYKVKSTEDKQFINNFIKRVKNLGLMTDDEIKEYEL